LIDREVQGTAFIWLRLVFSPNRKVSGKTPGKGKSLSERSYQKLEPKKEIKEREWLIQQIPARRIFEGASPLRLETGAVVWDLKESCPRIPHNIEKRRRAKNKTTPASMKKTGFESTYIFRMLLKILISYLCPTRISHFNG
jgi:hypothetical protein